MSLVMKYGAPFPPPHYSATLSKRERWRRMEQFECIALAGPIWAGDLLSKDDMYALRSVGLINFDGSHATLTPCGEKLFDVWRKVDGAPPNYPATRNKR